MQHVTSPKAATNKSTGTLLWQRNEHSDILMVTCCSDLNVVHCAQQELSRSVGRQGETWGEALFRPKNTRSLNAPRGTEPIKCCVYWHCWGENTHLIRAISRGRYVPTAGCHPYFTTCPHDFIFLMSTSPVGNARYLSHFNAGLPLILIKNIWTATGSLHRIFNT